MLATHSYTILGDSEGSSSLGTTMVHLCAHTCVCVCVCVCQDATTRPPNIANTGDNEMDDRLEKFMQSGNIPTWVLLQVDPIVGGDCLHADVLTATSCRSALAIRIAKRRKSVWARSKYRFSSIKLARDWQSKIPRLQHLLALWLKHAQRCSTNEKRKSTNHCLTK